MPPFQEDCTQCDSHTYTTKAPVEWVDYNRKMLRQLFQNGDTKEYKLLASPNGKCVARGKETEIPNLIAAVKKKPSAPLKELEEEEEEEKEEEEKSDIGSQGCAAARGRQPKIQHFFLAKTILGF